MTETNNKKNRKSRVYLFAIILVLILINLMLIYNLFTNNQKLTLTQDQLTGAQTELVKVERIKAELEEDLAFFKGQNDSLDVVIGERERKIQAQADEITALLSKSNLTAAELARAQRMIAQLESQRSEMVAEIDSLSKENQFLKDENYIIQKKLEAGEKYISEIEESNTELNQQVAVGKRIFLKSLEVTPLRKSLLSSAMKPTDKLSRMRELQINFTLANNDLADKGEKILYFKIQTPNQSTLVDETLGAGTFSYQGGESMYTIKKAVNFQNSNESGTLTIPKSDAFVKGEYVVYVYSDTHEMSSTKFVLR